MSSPLTQTNRERGAALVEYALVIALVALFAIPSITYLSSSISGSLDEAGTGIASASSSTSGEAADQDGGDSTPTTTAPSNGNSSTSGGGGGGGTPTTTSTTTSSTTTPPTTTTTMATATTTTTTTTTVAPQSPPQSKTAALDDEFAATFEVSDDVITLTDVDAGNWSYQVTKSTDTLVKVKFTSKDGDDVVLVKAWINKRGKLKVKVKELK